ncbi:MAG TPA: LysR family transcriptional regulator [Chromatiales bacterium]|nr:LysR family transcriptional regulator [Chromatiales bacterium]
MRPTLQQLRVFDAVVRNGSITRAAEELYLTQPAVSIQVKKLEALVGLPLLEQVGRRLHPTQAGRRVHASARRVLTELEALEESVVELKGVVKGELRIGVVTTAKYFMPHLLGAFVERHPQVEPRLTVTNRAQVLARLQANEDDLLIMGQVPEGLDVEAHPFLDNDLVVVAHAGHPLARERRIPMGRLCEERFLVREQGSGTRLAIEAVMAERGQAIEPYMELGDSEAIKHGILAGLGISVMSRHNIRLELEAGSLVILDVEGFPLRRKWYAVHPRTKKLSLTARTFLDFILTRAGAVLS